MTGIVLVVAVGLALFLVRRFRAPVAAPAEVGAVGWAPGARWAVARPLARVEAGRLLRHPAFVVGVVLTPLMLAAATGSESSWWRIGPSVALALVPLGWATIIAANLLALQPRRTGADELFAAAPAPQPVRSVGLMLSGLAASAVAGALALAWLIYMATGSRTYTGSLRPAEVVPGLLIVAGSVTVGVGVARWIPHVAFGIAAAFATAIIQARFFELSAWPWYRTEADPLRFLAFLADNTSVGVPALEIRPAGWHVAYLVGLVLLMACAALARDGVPRRLGVVLGAVFALTAVTGWFQVRPPTDGQLARMATYLTDPESHQTCTTEGQVRYCAFAENLGRVSDWTARVEAVRALLPAAAERPLVVADRVPTVVGNSNCSPQPFFEGLHPRLAGKVTAADVWPDDGAVHPGTDNFPCGGRPTHELFTAVQVGSWAVGLPPSPHHLDVRCAASGQARAAVALWLGAVVTPGGEATLRGLIGERTVTPGHMTFADWDSPPMLGVTFAISDAELARRLLALPSETVAGALAGAWDAVVAPGTTTADLARLTGLTTLPAVPDPPATGPVCP